MALTNNADIREIDSSFAQLIGDFGGGAPLAAATFYKGAIVVFDQADSKVKPGVTNATSIALGRCEEHVLPNSGLTGIRVRSGIFGPYNNSVSADLIANDDAGKLCYVVDDNTVALTSNTNARSIAGIVYKVDASGGVYVAINPLARS
jgi:hypothetical protein